MVDEFDPLKKTITKVSEDAYDVRTDVVGNDDLLRPAIEPIMKNYQTTNVPVANSSSIQQKPSANIYHTLDHLTTAVKAPVRPSEERTLPTLPSSSVIGQLPRGGPVPTSCSSQEYQNAPRRINSRDDEYEGEAPPSYDAEAYQEYSDSSIRKGFTATLNRLAERFPIIGLFYKPSVDPAPHDYEYEYEEQDDEAPQLVEADPGGRELTADELGLNSRYSNRLRTQIISLPVKDQTQPVDVGVHQDSYALYLCDPGRSVIEIYDFKGKLQHTIDDPLTLKFQPTAIAVSMDGTVIVSSHFQHRLQLYAPIDESISSDTDRNVNTRSPFHFQQYKLGAPGCNVNQFHHPAGIAIDPVDGYLYVCDRGNSRIQVLRPEGVCERVIELFLPGHRPSPIAPIQVSSQISGDQIVCIVGDADAICFLSKYSEGPTEVEPLYIVDNDGLGLRGATGLVLDANDRIFIADTGHHRIVICTVEGSYISHFGTEGDQVGQLKRPCGLAMTTDGTLVVADSGNKRLQLFGSMREQSSSQENNSSNNTHDSLIDTITDSTYRT